MKKSLILLLLCAVSFNLFSQEIQNPPESKVNKSLTDSCETIDYSAYKPVEPRLDTFFLSSPNIDGQIMLVDNGEYINFTPLPSQKKVWDHSPLGIIKGINYKKTAWVAGIGLFRGFAWGTHEVLNYWYSDFQRRFPNANPGFWNPDQSWTNKYKNGDEKQGEAFPLSTTALVPFTDASHLTAALNSASLVGMGIVITLGEKKPWYYYLIDAGVGFIASGIGFEIAKETLRKR